MNHLNRPEPTKEFIMARQYAGSHIEKMIVENRDLRDRLTYRWIKPEWSYPSFEHFSFAYKNAIFSVFVDYYEDEQSTMNENEISRLLEASQKYNLIPCVFPIVVEKGNICLPFSLKGWNLVDLRNGNMINPDQFGTDTKIPMSEWEIRNLSIQVSRDEIIKRRWHLLSFCDIPEIDPQIWVKDENGRIIWVLVRTIFNNDSVDKSAWLNNIDNIGMVMYDGYIIIIQITEKILYRGYPINYEYERFECIKKASR